MAEFDALAQRLAPQLSDSGRLTLRRVVAVYRLSANIEKRQPLGEAEAALVHAAGIGFADIKEEAVCRFMLARYSFDCDDPSAGLRALGEIIGRLQGVVDATGNGELANLVQRMKPLADTLRAAATKHD
jgi:hypothetical protein